MAVARRSTRPGLSQGFPERQGDTLARKYAILNEQLLDAVEELLAPALEANDMTRITLALAEIERVAQSVLPDDQVAEFATAAAALLARTHGNRFFRSLRGQTGLDIVGSDQGPSLAAVPGQGSTGQSEAAQGLAIAAALAATIAGRRPKRAFLVLRNPQIDIIQQQFVSENVRLIRKLKTNVAGALAKQIAVTIQEGGDVRELITKWRKTGVPALIPTSRVLHGGGVEMTVSTDNHAALIARDQVSKLNGQLTKARQQAAGIKRFKWRTQGDSRVRPQHREFGRAPSFSWDAGAPGGIFPGQPVNCRCWPQAVLTTADVESAPGLQELG